jgi:hypothetical protein
MVGSCLAASLPLLARDVNGCGEVPSFEDMAWPLKFPLKIFHELM